MRRLFLAMLLGVASSMAVAFPLQAGSFQVNFYEQDGSTAISATGAITITVHDYNNASIQITVNQSGNTYSFSVTDANVTSKQITITCQRGNGVRSIGYLDASSTTPQTFQVTMPPANYGLMDERLTHDVSCAPCVPCQSSRGRHARRCR